MKKTIGAAFALAMLAALPAQAHVAGALPNPASSAAVKVDWDDWHGGWRGHYGWGGWGWHNRWRSHYRWGSNYGGGWGWHNRWRSHYRWGSHYGGGWGYGNRWWR